MLQLTEFKTKKTLNVFFIILYSLNLEAQWNSINGPFNNGLSRTKTFAVAIDSSHIFALDESGTYLSEDDGSTWKRFSSPIGNQNHKPIIAINGNNIFVAGSMNHIYKTNFNSGIWETASVGIVAANITGFALTSTQAFASTDCGGLYTSFDNGTTWQLANNSQFIIQSGINQYSVTALFYGNGKLYAGSGYGNSNGLYVSSDNGLNWTLLLGSINGSCSSIIAYDNTILVGYTVSPFGYTGSQFIGAYISHNNGQTWTVDNTIQRTTSFFKSNGKVFATTYGYNISMGWTGNTFMSDSNLINWTPLGYRDAAGCSYNSKVVVVEGIGRSIMNLSHDGGTTWGETNNNTICDVVVDDIAFIDSTITIAHEGVGFTSLNQGISWNHDGFYGGCGHTPKSGSITTIGNKLFVSRKGSGSIRVSSDTGRTWSSISISPYEVYALGNDGTNIYAGTLGGIYKSNNYGSNWTLVSNIPQVHDFFFKDSDIYAFAGNIWILSNTDNIYKSSDGGTTWSSLGFPYSGNHIMSMTSNGNDIFIATEGYGSNGLSVSAGILKSTDNGITWNVLRTGIYSALVYTEGLLFAANVAPSGLENYIYMSSDTGLTWSRFDNGLNLGCRFNKLAREGEYLYCCTDGHGLWQTALPSLSTDIKSVNNEIGSINIYPNPSKGEFTIDCGVLLKGMRKIKVVNILGEIIAETESSSRIQNIELNRGLARGVYFVEIFSRENSLISSKRVLIE